MKKMIEFAGVNNRKVMIEPSKIAAFMDAVSFCDKKGTIVYLVGDVSGIFIDEEYEDVKQKLGVVNA